MFFPVTLATASGLALIYLIIVFRVGRTRMVYRVAMGDGGNPELVMRMRTQANFTEYVPLMIVLMGLLEGAGANPLALSIGGVGLMLLRGMHMIGMPKPVPNIYRAAGATGTILLLAAEAVWGAVIVMTAH